MKISKYILSLFLIANFAEAAIVQCTDPIGNGANACGFRALGQTLTNIITYVLGFGFVLSAIGFAYAGFYYVAAFGDSGKIKKAHEIFQKILLGFILACAAFLIVDLIAAAFDLQEPIKVLYNRFVN